MTAPDAPRPPTPAAYEEPEDEMHKFIVTLAKAINYRAAWKLQRGRYHEEAIDVAPQIPIDTARVSLRTGMLCAARREYDAVREALRSMMPRCGGSCGGGC